MTDQNIFMRLPTELRLMIVDCLLPDKPKRLQLLCCNDCNAWDEAAQSVYEEVTSGVKDALSLSRASRTLRNEVRPVILNRVLVKFCLRQNGDYGTRISGLRGHSFSADKRISDVNTLLEASLRNFRHNTLAIDVHDETGYTGDLKCLPLYKVLNQGLPLLDDLRHFVEAINASPFAKHLTICLKIYVDLQPEWDEVYWALQPLERLRPDLDLFLRFQNADPEAIDNRIDISKLTAIQQDYLESLLHRRADFSAQAIGESLIDDWIHLRAWLLLTCWDIHTENLGEEQFPETLTRHFAIDMSSLDRHYDHKKLRGIVLDTWGAHDHRTTFRESKQELKKWFVDYSTDQLDVMMGGFRGMDLSRQNVARRMEW